MSEPVAEHEHVWEYWHTNYDWWDGDADKWYYCSVEGCKETKMEYIPR